MFLESALMRTSGGKRGSCACERLAYRRNFLPVFFLLAGILDSTEKVGAPAMVTPRKRDPLFSN